MYVPVFTLNLNQKILPGRVVIGEYDGKYPCLTAATTAEKIFIHNPHQRMGLTTSSGRLNVNQGKNQELAMLNINQRVTALATGRMFPDDPHRDCLLVGTPTNLLAYDVHNNADIFHKDVEDGVNAIAVGHLGNGGNNGEKPLAIVGGNCSLQGFDSEGNDPFWTVTGDNVTSIILMDYNNDGKNELIVGSEDYEIRIFAEDEILKEITETEAITALTPVEDGRFGYALANGTVGVYEKTTRWWRIKSKNSATSIFSFDLDGDGVKELITGWSNGKLDARNDRSGEVVFKDNLNHSVAGLTEADYRLDGKLELIVCGSEGEVRGYLPSSQGSDPRRNLLDLNVEQDTIRELSVRRQNLLLELKNYEENQRIAAASSNSSGGLSSLGSGIIARALSSSGLKSSSSPGHHSGMNEMGVIPAQTQLQTSLAVSLGSSESKPGHVELSMHTNNDTFIKCVLIFAEGIFDGECHVVHPKVPESGIRVPIYPPKDVPVDLHIKAFVGYNGKNFHVFELTRGLPRFSMYYLMDKEERSSSSEIPKGHVSFRVNERVSRVAIWLNQNFLLENELEPEGKDGESNSNSTTILHGSLDLKFVSLRKNDEQLHFKMGSNGDVDIYCDNMEIAGDFVQSLAEYLALEDLKSVIDFPEELNKLQDLLVAAEDLQNTRQRLSAEMADHSGLIRTLVVRAEDSRLMLDTKNMKKWYSQLYDINRDLIYSYKIRCKNHEELMDTLKQVNQIIQRAGRLRVGKTKAKIISDCRTAIKDNNIAQLLKVIKSGEPL